HRLFAEHYHDLEGALNEIAERIRALGFFAASSYREYLELASIHDMNGSTDPWKMVEHVVHCHRQVMSTAREVYHIAQEVGDVATADLAQERMGMHDKGAWVLSDFLHPSN
ncbi:MAG TPA: ferritin-like domain-containing protein, partial [Opitutales bacterium]|nr:ferritin-like domain-containing protein [Opitutales bacterium]